MVERRVLPVSAGAVEQPVRCPSREARDLPGGCRSLGGPHRAGLRWTPAVIGRPRIRPLEASASRTSCGDGPGQARSVSVRRPGAGVAISSTDRPSCSLSSCAGASVARSKGRGLGIPSDSLLSPPQNWVPALAARGSALVAKLSLVRGREHARLLNGTVRTSGHQADGPLTALGAFRRQVAPRRILRREGEAVGIAGRRRRRSASSRQRKPSLQP